MIKTLFAILYVVIIGLPTVTSAQIQLPNNGVPDKTNPPVIKQLPARDPFDSISIDQADSYRYIDSILNQGKYDQMKRMQESLLSGVAKMGWFSFDLSRVKRYNQFEGLYLGAGGFTNADLFRSVSIGGFAGYGFKDRKTKYGFDVSVWPDKTQHLTLKAGYSYDTRESAGNMFFDEKSGVFDPASFRFFYVRKMDYEQKTSLSVSFKQDVFTFYGALQRRIIERGYDISNGTIDLLPDHYNVSGIVAGIRFSPGEITAGLPDNSDSKRFSFPVLWFQVTRGIPGMFNGDYNYNRYEGKIQFVQNIKHLGRSSLQLIGNLLEGNAPYFEYFNGRGTFGNFGLYASGSFVTMHPDEFMNDKSLGLFFTHNFGEIMFRSDVSNPNPVLVFNYGWGALQKNPVDYFPLAMDMHKGFVEAGVQVNNLIDLKVYGLGLGAYYRMGAYSNSKAGENLVFKIVISFPGKD